MANFPHHKSLRLQNFTAFQDATFDFVPGINALIGENGVGKTHVMKILFSIQFDAFRLNRKSAFPSTFEIFQSLEISDLIRYGTDKNATVNGISMDYSWEMAIPGIPGKSDLASRPNT